MHVELAKVLLVENSPDPILVVSEERFVAINRAALKLFGLRNDAEAIGELLPPFFRDPLESVSRDLGSPLPRGQGATVGRRLHRPDGTSIEVELTCVPLSSEGKSGMLVVARDVTERTRRDALVRLQADALKNMSEGMVVCDENHVITLTNPAFDRIFGYNENELTGKHIGVLNAFTRAETDDFLARIDAELSRLSSWSGEIPNRKKDGTAFCTFARIGRLEIGGRRHLVSFQEDLTGRKIVEARMLRNQRMDAIGALAGGIAHDLNNALAAVMLSTHLVQMNTTEPTSLRMLGLIAESTRRSADLVKQVLAFSRGPEDGRGTVQVERVAREVGALCRQTFPRSVDVRVDVAADLWPIVADPVQLYQALLNLCLNARDSMPEGGLLTIGAANLRLDELSVPKAPDARAGTFVTLTVADTGAGLTPQMAAQVFQPFFSENSAPLDWGLGLSIANGIVKNHGGFLSLRSGPGHGSEFKLHLPAEEIRRPSRPVPSAESGFPRGNDELILIVDDESAIRTIASKTLQAFGYRVLVASDGAQAVSLCAQHLNELQVMVTDMEMPIMDGASAIRAIRAIAPGVRIVATTGLDSRTKIGAKKLDVRICLYKPFSAEQLVNAVHTALHDKA